MAHDSILHDAFLNPLSNSPVRNALTAAEVAILMNSSREFDLRTQSSEFSNLHYLRRKGQSIEDAISNFTYFIDSTLNSACELAQSGDRNGALELLGQAMHPLMDSSSPVHADENGNPRIWNPWWPFGHSPFEGIGDETFWSLTPQILERQQMLLGGAYNRVFGDSCTCSK